MQGVGFRPFVHNLAVSLGLAGWVRNDAAGLTIEAEGPRAAVDTFLLRFRSDRPPAALVLAEETAWIAPAGYDSFHILASDPGADKSAAVLPDLATCPDCLAEILSPAERRFAYPFTNCTRCGPRFTIVLDIPYDRPRTVMREFALCDDCAAEYRDPRDRRFHAQPIACPRCGPQLTATVEETAAALARGAIVALKGIGGYQLLCDARSGPAVARLRERKAREAKPFAVMMPDLAAAERYAHLNDAERRLLTSSAAPIVLLRPRAGLDLAPQVGECSPYLGLMLPYSPLHHLLLRAFPYPVVATSGNRSDEPICIDPQQAEARLDGIADVWLHHNRPIARPCDDSVARVVRGRETLLRRARGYAPLPVLLDTALPRVLAVGGHLKNTVALALGRQVVVSQHLGDLDTWESRQAFERAIDDLCRLYSFTPDLIACDLHPDYYSTVWARGRGLPVVPVQHHLAHAASCAAENGLRGPYLGVGWDGTGYGTDGLIWGSEMFLIDGPRVERVAHLLPFRLPGGEAAVKQCWRCAASLLHQLDQPCDPRVQPLLDRGLHCLSTTSMGRLFDAVASLLGVAQENRFEGEAGLRLEALASSASAPPAAPNLDGDWREFVSWLASRPCSPAEASLAFHHALAQWIVRTARAHGVHQVALSGGCFQNVLLTELTCAALESAGIAAYTHQRVPANDGGLCLGQAVLTAPAASE